MDSKKERYSVEPDYEIAKGCRCCSCWEPTGRWLIRDLEDEMEDLIFETKEEAFSWAKSNLDNGSYNESY